MAGDLTMQVRIEPDLESLSQKLAQHIAKRIRNVLGRKKPFSLVLSGGNTPRRLYQLLAREHARDIPWSDVHLFWGDERCVPARDAQSNFGMAEETLLRHVPILPENVHPMFDSDSTPERAAAEYESLLRTYFQEHSLGFDLILLGMGTDGHTASLFPGSSALEEKTHWVTAVQAPVDPRLRLTLTFPVINQASHVCFLVSGRDKAGTVRRVIRGESSVGECPARGVRPREGSIIWWLDKEAARDLTD